MPAKVHISAIFQNILKLIGAGFVHPHISKLVCVAPAMINSQGEPPKPLVAQVYRAAGGKHLVIMRIKITLTCACGKVQSIVHLHQGRIFDTLVAGETYRSQLVRKTGNECVLVSSAKLCDRFRELASKLSIVARLEEGKFLHEQFERAASPASN